MDDRNLREYALNIYKGIRGYTLSKALSLFPKYYPKIAFYYAEMLAKQQNETSLRMIQALGIDKGRALLNELNILNRKIEIFYVNAKFRLNESYKRMEAATDEYDRNNILEKEFAYVSNIIHQSTDITKESLVLFNKILAESKMYNFKSLNNDIIKAMKITTQGNEELFRQNVKFLKNVIQQYQYKEL